MSVADRIVTLLRERRSGDLDDGLFLRAWPDRDLINISGRGRDLTRADVDAVRAALGETGYVEVDSWIATEGLSWLSDGVKSVSFRIRRRPLISDETIAEVAAMEERDRAAGGPPWEVPGHPDNAQPGGWHHGQLTGRPAPGWEGGDATGA